MRALVACALALAVVGCGNGQSLVVVDVSADAPLDGVAAFAVQASVGGKNATFNVAAPSGSFALNPATQSFGINVPKGVGGTMQLSLDAVDGQGNVLASGSGSAPVKAGGRVDLPITLAVAGAAADMGSDAPDLGSAPPDLALPSTGPMLAADRATQMFGSVTVGKSSNAVMIKITNGGDMPTGTLAFTPSGANQDQFTLTNGCSGTLAPNASCAVTAQFSPNATGDKSAHFDVSATPGGTVGVDVTGTGVPPGTLTIAADAPYNGDCGSALLNQTSTTFATYTVTNVGTSTTGTMTVSTGDPQFIASGCTGTLAPNATCTITVYVKPANRGTLTSSVQVQATPGGTAPANVQGHGLQPATFKLTSSTGSFSFGTAQRNSAGNVITFTATNTGDVTSNALARSTFTGPAASSFLVTSDGCYQQAVAANGTCTVQAEFKPLASGPLSATLQINDGASVLGSANVSGTGTPLWQQETLPLPSGATAVPALSVVFGVAGDGSHVYAAGGDNYYVRDATGTWTAYTMNTVAVTPTKIGQGSAVGVNSVFLASDVGVLRSTAPTAWSAIYEAGGALQGMFAFSATDAFAAQANGTTNTVYRLTGTTWASDAAITGYGGGVTGRTALFGTSDNDLWLGGGADLGATVVHTPVVWHRDSTGTWSMPMTVEAGCHTCIGGVSPSVSALWGFGTPTTTLFASTYPVEPAVYSGGTWTTLANVPAGMGGSGKTCAGVWGSSPTAVWFSCDGGMFLYTGGGTWDANSQLNVNGFTAVWGSSAIDVYAVGTDGNGAGFAYHYF